METVAPSTFSFSALETQVMASLASGTIFSGHSDPLVCLWPGPYRLEVLWKGFLTPQDPRNPWCMNSQTQALNFINSGLHALTNDKMATPFVRELGKTDGRGVVVLQDVLNLTYSTDAGRQRDLVSFQRGLVPLVILLTMRRMEMVSQHMDEANYVYAFVRTAHVQLFRLYLHHLTQIVEQQSIEDRMMSHETFLSECEGRKFAPLCFTQVCLPIIRLLYLLGTKFKEFIYEDTFQETVTRVDALTAEWMRDCQGENSALDSTLCFKTMREELKRLHKMVRRGEREMQAGAASRKAEEQPIHGSMPEPWDMLEVGVPGKAVLKDGSVGPRHDNDHPDICNIQLLPTTAECLSREPPLLPGNFPFHKTAHWLPPGPERWVDTHFRLYREDFCETIRSSLQDLYHRLVETHGNRAVGRLRDANVDYNVYPISDTAMPLRHTYTRGERDPNRRFCERHGLCIDVRFQQPSAAELTGRAGSSKQQSRKELWEKTGRLPFKGMVALVTWLDGVLQVIFCQIVGRDLEQLVQDVVNVTLQPFEAEDFATLEQWRHFASYKANQGQTRLRMLLLEFNNVFLVAYEPVLRALQSLHPATLPFLDYLAPEAPRAPEEGRVEPPMYCLADDFTFDLSLVIKTYPSVNDAPLQPLRLSPLEANSREACETALVHYSTLERDQAKALVEALSSRVACIQGLPGTGKSFIGAILTRIILKAKVSPVLVVCYTNHALDQFLCHLLDVGITSLVRVGGQCKEPRLDEYNLNKVYKIFQRGELKLLYEALDTCADAIERILEELHAEPRYPTWKSLKWFLETNYPEEYDYFAERYAELYETDDGDDWKVAGCNDILDYWIQGNGIGASLSHWQNLRCRGRGANVWTWSVKRRRDALAEWARAIRSGRVEELVKAQEAYRDIVEKIKIVKDQADVDILKKVQIVGMTTTGVAQNQQKITAVAPLVVICEEAGEVLEAQLMACLSPACQHLVLIGDHKQLRPHIASYNLSVGSALGQRFALDVSLFERLVGPTSGLPFWMLTEQHRMRPQISQLIRMLFYPEVRDACETLEYPPVLGVDRNVFFVNHDHPEDGASVVLGAPARSHSNEYEVAYIVATLRYLLQQGYHTRDIAILTPYVGQLMKLRSALRGEFVLELNELDLVEIQRTFDGDDDDDEDDVTWFRSPAALGATKKELSGVIRAATIDNFQGEEASIILASLVRSSPNVHGRGSIGFIKTPNRINVLLSRAKHGLILVGHGDLLRAKSPLWQQLLDHLQVEGCCGNGLPLHCQRHPNYQRSATSPQSFALLAPDGGCLRPCGKRLPRCGHACPKLCHVDQPSHKTIYCTQPCPRLQPGCEHVCPRVCGDACGQCKVLVGSIVLPCGHTYSNARCFEAKMPSKLHCTVPVEKTVLMCGHVQRVPCSTIDVKCTRTCGVALACGHACSRRCNDCVEKTLAAWEGPPLDLPIEPTEHGECRKECERLLPCCHRCRGICHGNSPCPPCQHICDVFRCEHGSCNHPCSEPCAACTELCNWSCDHCGGCSLPCGAPCNRPVCDQRCTKLLECGHQCPSVCGEDCPSRKCCHVCGDDDVKERVADVILFQTYAEIDPFEDPVFVLPCCSIVYTMSTLDGTLHMSTYYDGNGKPRGALPEEYLDMPQCPNCKKPIRGLRRYGRVTKRAAIDSADKNFISHAQRRLSILQERTHAAIGKGGFADDKTLRHDLRLFGVTMKSPPCQKVYEACVAVVTKAMGGQGGGDVDIDMSTLPVPNSAFPYLGYFYLLSAQLSMLYTTAPIARAEQYARQAVEKFMEGSFSLQTQEARLVLTQLLLVKAEEKFDQTVETENERTKREEAVERLTSEPNDLLCQLETSSASFLFKHDNDVRVLRQKLQSLVQRARNVTFYQDVSKEEMKAIKLAMQTEFSGSGHWYRCVNGHSYSIGECGMAMERSRCPECGAPVGGTNHSFVEGTEHDMQMDSL